MIHLCDPLSDNHFLKKYILYHCEILHLKKLFVKVTYAEFVVIHVQMQLYHRKKLEGCKSKLLKNDMTTLDNFLSPQKNNPEQPINYFWPQTSP